MDPNQQTQPNPLSQPIIQQEPPNTAPNNSPARSKLKIILVIFGIVILLISIGGYMLTKNITTTPIPTLTPISTPTPSQSPILGVPKTSASAITSPPSSMDGINTHTEVFGTDSDPKMITLGPKLGSHPELPAYDTHHGSVFELKIHGTPVLAPIDRTLVGFQNNSSYRTDGQNITPMDDLVLFFESTSPDWPGMIIFVYHLSSSPLLLGQNIDPDCSAVEHPREGNIQAQGRLFMGMRDYVTDKGNADTCQALIGYKVKRGELIGFAGTVPNSNGIGTHS
ncbi:MAG: hypothetical protein Q8O88_02185, partial [bacterium]|nr:hypothetical protein [bacterium]